MGEQDYQEITPEPAPATSTGHFARYSWIAGITSTVSIPVTVIPPTGMNAITLSTTPLGCGAVFNSATFDFNNTLLGFLNAMAFSDQASAANGFMIQQSADGINWDLDSAVASVPANTGVGIKAAITVRYARVSYSNGGIAQSVFRLGARATIA